MEQQEGYKMAVNQDLLEEAKKIASARNVSFPVEVPGFAGFFVAKADDPKVRAITGFLAEDGTSFKIGTNGAE